MLIGGKEKKLPRVVGPAEGKGSRDQRPFLICSSFLPGKTACLAQLSWCLKGAAVITGGGKPFGSFRKVLVHGEVKATDPEQLG